MPPKRTKSDIPKPEPEDDQKQRKEPPKYGWDGPLPSQKGGDGEENFMQKPPYDWKPSSDYKARYHSQCWCGNIKFEYADEPLDAKYCHCHQCQSLHGAPFQHAVIFPKTAVRMIHNKDDSLDWFSTEQKTSVHHVPCKVSCKNCRSPIFDEGRNMVLAYPSSFRFEIEVSDNHEPGEKESKGDKRAPIPRSFHPTAHIFYSQRSMDVPDGIPKWDGQKGHSNLIEELTDDENIMPKYKHRKLDQTDEPAPEDGSEKNEEMEEERKS